MSRGSNQAAWIEANWLSITCITSPQVTMLSVAGSRAKLATGLAPSLVGALTLEAPALSRSIASGTSVSVSDLLIKPHSGLGPAAAQKFALPGFQRGFAAQPALEEAASDDEGGATADVAPHPGMTPSAQLNLSAAGADDERCIEYANQPHYPDKAYLEGIRPSHRAPASLADHTGYLAVQALRRSFDLVTGYGAEMTAQKWLTRFLFLETVAGVPGMVGAMMRHLRSLRTMQKDKGWIHTLLEEAENERIHLISFLALSSPGAPFRFAVIGAQGVFMTLYTLFYAISPRHCHAFVSYLEEEAVRTYSRCIDDIDAGKLPEWNGLAVPSIARKYWRLAPDATMRDLLLVVRADEACHAHVNTQLSTLPQDAPNPFAAGNAAVRA